MKKLLSLILTVFMLSGLIFSVNLNTANALSVTEHTESFEDFEGSILSYSALTEISSEHSRTGDNSLKISGDDIAQYSMNGAIVKGLDYSAGTNSTYVIDLYYLAVETPSNTDIVIVPFVCNKTNPWSASVLNNKITDYVYKTDRESDGWQHASLKFDTTDWKYGNCSYFGFTLYPSDKKITQYTEIYVDDVSIKRVDKTHDTVVTAHGARANGNATEIFVGTVGSELPAVTRGEDKFSGWFADAGLSSPITEFSSEITDIYASFETKPLSFKWDFEGSASDYNTDGYGTLTNEYAYDGSKSMKFTNTTEDGAVRLNLGKIEAGKTYLIGMYVKKSNPGIPLTLYTRLGIWPVHVEYHNRLQGGGSREPSSIPANTGGDFTYVSFLTTMPDSLVSTCAGQTKVFDELYVLSQTASADMSIYIDCVTVDEIRGGNLYVNVNNTFMTPSNRSEKAVATINGGIKFYPERTGYFFDGWYLDGAFCEPLSSFGEDVTDVFAAWTTDTKYTVTLDPNGGKLNSPNLLSVEPDSLLNVKNPSFEGYAFLGWYDSENQKVTTVTKDITLYAHWEKNTAVCTEHTYNSDCDEICNVCGSVREVSHFLPDEYSFNASNHWKTCTECNAKAGFAKHTYPLYYKKDADSHYLACTVCGMKTKISPHTDNDGDGLCDICGYCSFTYGDANFDNDISSKDLARLKKYLAGTTQDICPGADVTGDGAVNSKDLTRLKKYLAGLDVKLTPDDFGNIMILGDSYSTFEGYLPAGNATYYKQVTEGNNVSSVYETWWDIYANRVNGTIIRNDSWSGTTICNTGYNGSDASTISFTARIEKLISDGYFSDNKVDKLFIFGGTNDSWASSPVGEPKYGGGFTVGDKKQVLPALCCIIEEVTAASPDTEIVLIINCDLSAAITDGQENIAQHYGLKYLKLHDIEKQTGHPTVNGMKAISDQLYELIKH